MQTHDQVVKILMRRPGVRAEVARLRHEGFALLDALLTECCTWHREKGQVLH